MTSDSEPGDPAERSVFSKLPSARPGTRSPKRDSPAKASGGDGEAAPERSARARGAGGPPAGKAPGRRAPAAPERGAAALSVDPTLDAERIAAETRPGSSGSAPRKGEGSRKVRGGGGEHGGRGAGRDEAPEADSSPGLEDMAWAGVAVAAEAATLGVRIATRALERLRGSSEGR